MTLKEALLNKGNSEEEAEEIIDSMVNQVLVEGIDPETVLDEEGLEPDYVFDLLDRC
jgi:hypothetical protein